MSSMKRLNRLDRTLAFGSWRISGSTSARRSRSGTSMEKSNSSNMATICMSQDAMTDRVSLNSGCALPDDVWFKYRLSCTTVFDDKLYRFMTVCPIFEQDCTRFSQYCGPGRPSISYVHPFATPYQRRSEAVPPRTTRILVF